MSDSDNESAFESADEGDGDESQCQDPVQQPSPAAKHQEASSSQITKQDEHDGALGLSSDSKDALPQKENVPIEHPAASCFQPAKQAERDSLGSSSDSIDALPPKGYVHSEHPAASGFKAKKQDDHDDALGSSSDSEDSPPQKEDISNISNEQQATALHVKTNTVELVRNSGLQQSSVSLNSEQDEGLGDWDVGWEVDEDVLANNSSSDSAKRRDDYKETSQENVHPPIDIMKPEEGPSTGEHGDGESQVKEGMSTRKIERSANKERVLDKLCESSGQRQTQTSGWGWGDWSTSILSTATSSVSTFTSQVGHGLNSVLESVEATLGAPSPEELASQQSTSKQSDNEVQELQSETISTAKEDIVPQQSFLGAPLALSVGSISSKVIAGSLDTLELIGRKTMDILQEGDPGFKKKRSLLKTEKPILSEVLREAKERESEVNLLQEDPKENKINFGIVFDECQGLVHLEALEMLSKQSEQRIQVGLLSLMDDELIDMQTSLENFKETYESQTDIDTEENLEQEFEHLITQYSEGLNVVVNLGKLFKVQCDSQTWLQQCITDQDKGENKDAKDIHAKAIYFMAEFTARAVEVIHKIAELTLVMDNLDLSQGIQSFASFANVLCIEVSIQSSKYSSCLSTAADDSEDPDSVNPLITNVFVEASNSNTYIQDACHLLIPIFQLKMITAASNKHS